MADKSDNPWANNTWAKGGDEYNKSAVGNTGTGYLADGFLDTTESLQERRERRNNKQSLNSNSETNKRPSWKKVYEGYPKVLTTNGVVDEPAPDVFRELRGANYDKNVLSNACATRVSLGLLNGGMDVRKDFLISQGKFKGKGFIASALGLKDWLSKDFVWGSADEKIQGPTNFETVKSKIDGRNGVYIILGGFASDITGHATLWLGNENNVIGGHNYIDYGGTVYFWELK